MIMLTASNIIAVYLESTAAQRADGLTWYRDAHGIAARLDPSDPSRAAAVLAVLSPQTDWKINVDRAIDAYAGRIVRGLPASAQKAHRIMLGEDPDSVAGGDKVRAFWALIADPDNDTAVCVDRHAFDVAAGRVTDDATRGAGLGRKGGYAAVADLYREAAKIISADLGQPVTPAQVQAVTWVVWRETRIRTAAAVRKAARRAA